MKNKKQNMIVFFGTVIVVIALFVVISIMAIKKSDSNLQVSTEDRNANQPDGVVISSEYEYYED